FHQGGVLVLRAGDGQRPTVVHDPRPAAPEAAEGRCGEALLERVEAAEGRVDRGREIRARRAAAVGAHDLPEPGVVGMAAAIVTDRGALVLCALTEVGEDL